MPDQKSWVSALPRLVWILVDQRPRSPGLGIGALVADASHVDVPQLLVSVIGCPAWNGEV